MTRHLVPAVLSSSQTDLTDTLALVSRLPSIERVQIDVVDGRFATPASWPYVAPEEMSAMVREGKLLPYADRFDYEMDLMCTDAEQAADDWLALGAARLTFHAEALHDPARTLASVQDRHGREIISYGLALNIATPLSRIEPYLDVIDYVQFMGIATIGRQAQPFDRRVLDKVREFLEQHPDIPVQVDGGVSETTAPDLLAAGVSDYIVGSAILGAKDPHAVVEKLEHLLAPKRTA